MCRAYYNDKIKRMSRDTNMVIDACRDQEMSEEAIQEIVEKPEDLVITDTGVKVTTPEPVKSSEADEPKTSYHKMYGDDKNMVQTIIPAVQDEPEVYAREQPYLIRRTQFYDEYDDYKKVQLMYFIGDVTKTESGDLTYVPVVHSEGIMDKEAVGSDSNEWEDRAIKLDEIERVIGHEWQSHIGDDSYNGTTGYDYDINEAYVANDKLKTCFAILRDERMYKVVIAGLEPGDEFDYSKVR
jgi:hypothetical protein